MALSAMLLISHSKSSSALALIKIPEEFFYFLILAIALNRVILSRYLDLPFSLLFLYVSSTMRLLIN